MDYVGVWHNFFFLNSDIYFELVCCPVIGCKKVWTVEIRTPVLQKKLRWSWLIGHTTIAILKVAVFRKYDLFLTSPKKPLPNLSPEHKINKGVSGFYAQGTDFQLFLELSKIDLTFWNEATFINPKCTYLLVLRSSITSLEIKHFQL